MTPSKAVLIDEVVPCMDFPGWIARFFSCGHGEVVWDFWGLHSLGNCRLCGERRNGV